VNYLLAKTKIKKSGHTQKGNNQRPIFKKSLQTAQKAALYQNKTSFCFYETGQ
jgi:hypothetical protein